MRLTVRFFLSVMLLFGFASLQLRAAGWQHASAAGDTEAATTVLSDLSASTQPKDVKAAMRFVANWQVAHAAGKWNQDWSYVPLYLGLLATSETLGDQKYYDVVLRQAEAFDWKLYHKRPLHADDEAMAQVYEALYRDHPQPIRLADARSTFDRLVAYNQGDVPPLLKRYPHRLLWWWSDALFMAPPGLAEMSTLTGDKSYVEAMDHQWSLTQQQLYDSSEHLFFRSKVYIHRRGASGQKIFWARGNAWVLAGLANVLAALPAGDHYRADYVHLFQQMAARIAQLQQPDGLWRTGLLDPEGYPQPEISASALFTYALAWGVNHGILSRRQYTTVIKAAWAGMVRHIYRNGRLGDIQPVGENPRNYPPTASYVFGVGAFLLAGRQVCLLDQGMRKERERSQR